MRFTDHPAVPEPRKERKGRVVWILGIVITTVIALVLVGLTGLHKYLQSQPQDLAVIPSRTVEQNEITLTLLVPETEEQKGRGLSGAESFPEDTALLLRADDGDTRIMMLGMRFSLDLVWLDSSCSVVHVAQNAAPGFWPLFYSSPAQSSAVIEMTAGDAHRYGLDHVGAAFAQC